MGKRDAFREEGAAERRNGKRTEIQFEPGRVPEGIPDGRRSADRYDSASERAPEEFHDRKEELGNGEHSPRGAGKRSDIQHYGDGACERAECLLLPQASADGTAAVAAVPRKVGGICAGAAHAVVKGTAGRML